jgi:hypothetical protein
MFFDEQLCKKGQTAAMLDRDCVTGFGPETITINGLSKISGSYDVVVTEYTSEKPIGMSGAYIEVLSAVTNPHQVWYFNVSANGAINTADYGKPTWEVFSIGNNGLPVTYNGRAVAGSSTNFRGTRKPLPSRAEALYCHGSRTPTPQRLINSITPTPVAPPVSTCASQVEWPAEFFKISQAAAPRDNTYTISFDQRYGPNGENFAFTDCWYKSSRSGSEQHYKMRDVVTVSFPTRGVEYNVTCGIRLQQSDQCWYVMDAVIRSRDEPPRNSLTKVPTTYKLRSFPKVNGWSSPARLVPYELN